MSNARDAGFQIVGRLKHITEALSQTYEQVDASDKRTLELVDAARMLATKAITSAWENASRADNGDAG